MSQAKDGDTVRVHYTGKLADGSVFDTSREREPLEFQLGEGRVIAGFEQAVRGMSPGEQTTAEVPADDAYGQRRDDMVLSVDRTEMPDGLQPEVGQQLQVTQPNGRAIPVRIVEVSDDAVKLDANHPLAGKDLTFDLQLVEIV
ncbi:MAG: peptidylprolyl isomerase [Pirellulaceae bacterium]